VVSFYGLPELGKPTVLAAARNAHAFAVSSYNPVLKATKAQTEEDGSVKTAARKDLVIIGCRKKVLVYGAGKSFRDPWVSVQFLLILMWKLIG